MRQVAAVASPSASPFDTAKTRYNFPSFPRQKKYAAVRKRKQGSEERGRDDDDREEELQEERNVFVKNVMKEL